MEMSLRAPLIWRALQLYKFAIVLCVLWVILAAVTGPVLKHWKMDLKYCMVTPVQTVYFYDLHPFILGNDFDINVADLWSSSSPWPLCNMPKSYFFLVKNPWLWRMSFRCSEPELLHEALFTVRYFFAQHFSWGLLWACIHPFPSFPREGLHGHRRETFCPSIRRLQATFNRQRTPAHATCAGAKVPVIILVPLHSGSSVFCSWKF